MDKPVRCLAPRAWRVELHFSQAAGVVAGNRVLPGVGVEVWLSAARVSREEAAMRRAVVTVGQQAQTALEVGVVPKLRMLNIIWPLS